MFVFIYFQVVCDFHTFTSERERKNEWVFHTLHMLTSDLDCYLEAAPVLVQNNPTQSKKCQMARIYASIELYPANIMSDLRLLSTL